MVQCSPEKGSLTHVSYSGRCRLKSHTEDLVPITPEHTVWVPGPFRNEDSPVTVPVTTITVHLNPSPSGPSVPEVKTGKTLGFLRRLLVGVDTENEIIVSLET